MNPKVTVVIPIYNGEKYLDACLESIYRQTLHDIEVILVDDGSKDRTSEICKQYVLKDERFKYIYHDNRGVVYSRGVGIDNAKSEYIAFIDSDDVVEYWYLEKILKEIDGYDVVATSFVKHIGKKTQYINEKTKYQDCKTKGQMLFLYEHLLEDDFRGGIQPYMWNKLFRTELVRKIYPYIDDRIYFCEDGLFVYLYYVNCNSSKIVDLNGYHYFIREKSAVSKKDENFLLNLDLLYKSYKKLFKDTGITNIDDQINRYISKLIKIQTDIQLVYEDNYYYPWFARLEGKSIALYGAGNVGKSYYKAIMQDDTCNLKIWVDKKSNEIKNDNVKIYPIEKLITTEYDYIVLAVYDKPIAKEIIDSLVEMGIQQEKILWSPTFATCYTSDFVRYNVC